MASRKRTLRPIGALRRKRRSHLPLLENLEERLVLSQGTSLPVSPDMALVPVALAHGGTAWFEAAGAAGPGGPTGSDSSQGTASPSLRPAQADLGVILGSLPVSSPIESAAQGSPGPAGYLPQQIQDAYGLSNGSAYNNDISFGSIEGDGTGQTIGIFEEGYNPAFVDTSASSYSSSALASLRQDLRPARPAQPDVRRPYGAPLSSSNNSGNNPDFDDYGAGLEIALDIEWAHAMAPGASIVVLCATQDPGDYYEDIPLGIATLAGLPDVSVVSASYGYFLDLFGQQGLEQGWDSSIIQPALAANPDVSIFAATGDDASAYGLVYPAASPEVVSVGGTSLTVTKSGQWINETGWGEQRRRRTARRSPLPSYQQDDGFAGNVLHRAPTPTSPPTPTPTPAWPSTIPTTSAPPPHGCGRRDQPGDAALGRHGRDRRPGPRPRRRHAPRLDRDADGPLQSGQDRPRRLPRHHPGQQRLPRRTRATTWSPAWARPRPTSSSPTSPPMAWPARRSSSPSRRPASSLAASFGIIAQAATSYGATRPHLHRHRHPLAGSAARRVPASRR